MGPGYVWRKYWEWAGTLVGLSIITILLAVPVLLVGWKVGGWFSVQDETRQGQIIQNGYSNQQSQRGELAHEIAVTEGITAQIDKGGPATYLNGLKGQRSATVSLACQAAVQINSPLPADQAAFVKTNCQDGSISPSSPYYVIGGN